MSNRSDYQLNTIKNEKTRSCGNCDACCTVLSISCLDKPAGVRCSHLIQNSEDQAGAGACSIYDDRPEPCAGFVCVWLRDNIGLLSEEDRPDLSGILFTASAADSNGQQTLEAREVRPNAAQTPQATKILTHLRGLTPLRVIPFEAVGKSVQASARQSS